MKTLTLNEAETTELIVLIRKELEELDKLTPPATYKKFWERRIEIMNSLHDQLVAEEA